MSPSEVTFPAPFEAWAVIVPKVEEASLRVIFAPLSSNVSKIPSPETVSVPLSVMSPSAETLRLPVTVDAPRSRSPASKIVTLRPLTETVPWRSLSTSSILMSPVPALRVMLLSAVTVSPKVWSPTVVMVETPVPRVVLPAVSVVSAPRACAVPMSALKPVSGELRVRSLFSPAALLTVLAKSMDVVPVRVVLVSISAASSISMTAALMAEVLMAVVPPLLAVNISRLLEPPTAPLKVVVPVAAMVRSRAVPSESSRLPKVTFVPVRVTSALRVALLENACAPEVVMFALMPLVPETDSEVGALLPPTMPSKLALPVISRSNKPSTVLPKLAAEAVMLVFAPSETAPA